MKQRFSVDRFEGRSWRGRHRHAPMKSIAYAFLLYHRLAKVNREIGPRHGPCDRACFRREEQSSRHDLGVDTTNLPTRGKTIWRPPI